MIVAVTVDAREVDAVAVIAVVPIAINNTTAKAKARVNTMVDCSCTVLVLERITANMVKIDVCSVCEMSTGISRSR